MKFAMQARVDTVYKKAERNFPAKYLCKNTEKVLNFYRNRPYADKIEVKLLDEKETRIYADFNCFSGNGFSDDSGMTGIYEATNLFIVKIIKDEKQLERYCVNGAKTEFNPEEVEQVTVYIKNATVHAPKVEFYLNDKRYPILSEKIVVIDESENKGYRGIPVHKFTGLKGYIDIAEISIKRGDKRAREMGVIDTAEIEKLRMSESIVLQEAAFKGEKELRECAGVDIDME